MFYIALAGGGFLLVVGVQWLIAEGVWWFSRRYTPGRTRSQQMSINMRIMRIPGLHVIGSPGYPWVVACLVAGVALIAFAFALPR